MDLKTLCTKIRVGYDSEKTMYDMTELAEELTSRAGEILSLIDPYTSADGAAKETPEPAIPHADLIRAVLDGKVVQHQNAMEDGWVTLSGGPAQVIKALLDYPGRKVRLKPGSAVLWATVWQGAIVGHGNERAARTTAKDASSELKVLRLELDPDTLDVINARTEAP